MIPLFPPLLAADFGDVFGALIVIIVVIVGVVGQLISKMKEMSGGPAAPPRPRPPAAPPRGAPLNDEISEFLRRAGQQRSGSAPQQQPAGRRPLVQVPRPPLPKTGPRSSREEPVEVVPIDEEQGRFQPLAATLRDDVAESNRRMEGHLRQVFDHQLGRIGDPSSEAALSTASQESTMAGDRAMTAPSTGMGPGGLAAFLGSGAGLVQAFLLSEVLARPEDRWR